MAEHAVLYAARNALDSGPAHRPGHRAGRRRGQVQGPATSAALITGAMIQYHGGIGYTWEHETHFLLQGARSDFAGTYGNR